MAHKITYAEEDLAVSLRLINDALRSIVRKRWIPLAGHETLKTEFLESTHYPAKVVVMKIGRLWQWSLWLGPPSPKGRILVESGWRKSRTLAKKQAELLLKKTEEGPYPPRRHRALLEYYGFAHPIRRRPGAPGAKPPNRPRSPASSVRSRA